MTAATFSRKAILTSLFAFSRDVLALAPLPECVKYFEDAFGLSSSYIYADSDKLLQGVELVKKVPRVVRSKLPDEVQRKITAVGWSKFFAYKEELVKSLFDKKLNNFDGNENFPIFDRDEEIKASARKIRKLKKNCL